MLRLACLLTVLTVTALAPTAAADACASFAAGPVAAVACDHDAVPAPDGASLDADTGGVHARAVAWCSRPYVGAPEWHHTPGCDEGSFGAGADSGRAHASASARTTLASVSWCIESSAVHLACGGIIQ